MIDFKKLFKNLPLANNQALNERLLFEKSLIELSKVVDLNNNREKIKSLLDFNEAESIKRPYPLMRHQVLDEVKYLVLAGLHLDDAIGEVKKEIKYNII